MLPSPECAKEAYQYDALSPLKSELYGKNTIAHTDRQLAITPCPKLSFGLWSADAKRLKHLHHTYLPPVPSDGWRSVARTRTPKMYTDYCCALDTLVILKEKRVTHNEGTHSCAA